MTIDARLNSAWWALRIAFGLAVFLAGLDKFFYVLTDWSQYLNPRVAGLVPATTFMFVVGVIEMIVGAAILTRWTRIGAYVAAAWLVGIVINLLGTGTYFDIAVRDLVMATGAYALGRLTEARETGFIAHRPTHAEQRHAA